MRHTHNATHTGSNPEIRESELKALQAGQLYLSEISPTQRNTLYEGVLQEQTDPDGTIMPTLEGKYMHAFLGSTHGLVRHGVMRAKKPGVHNEVNLVTFEDLVNAYYMIHIPLLVQRLQKSEDPELFRGKIPNYAWSNAARYNNMHGGSGVQYPARLRSAAMLSRLLQVTEEQLQETEKRTLIKRVVLEVVEGKVTETSRLHTVADTIGELMLAREAAVEPLAERPWHDAVWDADFEIEDDEFIDDQSRNCTDLHDNSLDDVIDALDAGEIFRKLPLYLLSDQQLKIIALRYGFGETSLETLQEIADVVGVTNKAVSSSLTQSLSILRDPDSYFRDKFKKKTSRTNRLKYGLYCAEVDFGAARQEALRFVETEGRVSREDAKAIFAHMPETKRLALIAHSAGLTGTDLRESTGLKAQQFASLVNAADSFVFVSSWHIRNKA